MFVFQIAAINGIDRLNPHFIEPFACSGFTLRSEVTAPASGHEGDSVEHSKALWPRSQMEHGASQRRVGTVWVINIRLNSDTSDLAQTTSVGGRDIKHLTQHQIETVSRCISTIYCRSFDLRWRSVCASGFFWGTMTRWHLCEWNILLPNFGTIWTQCLTAEDVNKALKTSNHN